MSPQKIQNILCSASENLRQRMLNRKMSYILLFSRIVHQPMDVHVSDYLYTNSKWVFPSTKYILNLYLKKYQPEMAMNS
jgi:hypothetical protein